MADGYIRNPDDPNEELVTFDQQLAAERPCFYHGKDMQIGLPFTGNIGIAVVFSDVSSDPGY